ncbi:IS66 family transposase [Klebsiella pneumoniae]
MLLPGNKKRRQTVVGYVREMQRRVSAGTGGVVRLAEQASIRRPILRGSAGVLQADAAAGFQQAQHRDGHCRFACWAHALPSMRTFARRQP